MCLCLHQRDQRCTSDKTKQPRSSTQRVPARIPLPVHRAETGCLSRICDRSRKTPCSPRVWRAVTPVRTCRESEQRLVRERILGACRSATKPDGLPQRASEDDRGSSRTPLGVQRSANTAAPSIRPKSTRESRCPVDPCFPNNRAFVPACAPSLRSVCRCCRKAASAIAHREGEWQVLLAQGGKRPGLIDADRGEILIRNLAIYFGGSRQTLRIPLGQVVRFEPYPDGIGVYSAGEIPRVFVPDYYGLKRIDSGLLDR
jgi:hypothetical protein